MSKCYNVFRVVDNPVVLIVNKAYNKTIYLIKVLNLYYFIIL